MKERLDNLRKMGKKVKILFDYPNSKSVKVRRGYVKEIRETSFDLEEDRDGLMTYRYKYIVEVMEI